MRRSSCQRGAMSLAEHERAILDFERTWWTEPGLKEEGIRERLRMSPARYYRTIRALLDSPDAMSYDPLVVRRLRRSRDLRRRTRFEGRPAGEPQGR